MPDSTHAQRPVARLKYGDGALGLPSDERLVALLRQGHQSAFETLAARYQARLLWFCWQILRSKEDAEDALQDVYAAAFRAILADERDIQVRPWLYRIARNRCINQVRRARTAEVEVLDDDHVELGGTLVEKVLIRQRLRELVDDLRTLPDTQRTALLLREIDGFAYQRIATAMETTVPAVKSLLVRGRAAMHAAAALRGAGFAAPVCAPLGETQGARGRRGARSISYEIAHAAVSDDLMAAA